MVLDPHVQSSRLREVFERVLSPSNNIDDFVDRFLELAQQIQTGV